MFCSCALFTNNHAMKEKISAKHCRLEFVEGTSLEVLFAVRDAVHLGAKLLTHPLYGNLRPYQQPFRTVLVEDMKGKCCFESLSFLENAIDVYQSCADRLIRPSDLSEAIRKDYEFVDIELMRESFEKYRVVF